MARRLLIATFVPLFCIGLSAVARAQIAPAAEMPALTETTAPVETDAPAEGLVPVATLPVATASNAPQWGGAFRARWVTLPHWFLGMFTKHNQALSSYAMAVEGFRRKRDPENPNRFTEISLAFGYQNMSPPDGNWLGKNKAASIDTDWVQAKNFGLWTIDIAYIARQYFNEVVGIHYGAGLGLGIVQGKILRTSSSPQCTDNNLDSPACRPVVCTSTKSGCSEADLVKSTTNNPYPDTAETPKRFKESSVPGAIPIVNLLFGVDFRIPSAKGLEFRLEAGFFDALFMGGGVAYVY
jgi:hypothetical protein